ncbi:hypothetical protein LTR85_001775 [Meristemomyces frigidus]|nr:hypothetical protein LTR85_001775 [Meristemomyces frigidus]
MSLRLTRSHSTPKPDATCIDPNQYNIDTRHDDGFVIVDECRTPNVEFRDQIDAFDPLDFVIGDDDDVTSPSTTTHSPSLLRNTPSAMVGAGSISDNFIAMTEPSVEAIANAKIQILRNNLRHQEERIEAHKQDIQRLLEEHARQRDADRIDYDRKLDAQMTVHHAETSASTERHFVLVHKHDRELADRDKDRKAEITALQQAYEAETQTRKLDHDAEVKKLKQAHEAELTRLKQSHTAELNVANRAADGMMRDHNAETQKLQKHHKEELRKHQKAVSELKDQPDDLEQHHMVVLSTKERSHNADMESLQQTQLNNIEELQAVHKTRVEAMEAERQALVQSYEGKMTDMKAGHDATLAATVDHMIEEARQDKMHVTELADIKLEHRSELDIAKRAHEDNRFADSQIHEAEVNQLHSQIEGLKTELGKTKTQASRYRKEREGARMQARNHANASSSSQLPTSHPPTSSAPMPPPSRK